MSRAPDCPHDCDWRNDYRTCTDGSREYALYRHLDDDHGGVRHPHRPDGPARVGVECVVRDWRGRCEETVAETCGTFDEPEIVWTDGAVTGRWSA